VWRSSTPTVGGGAVFVGTSPSTGRADGALTGNHLRNLVTGVDTVT
jgi:hypothetical protein